jgi:hypothetical protein
MDSTAPGRAVERASAGYALREKRNDLLPDFVADCGFRYESRSFLGVLLQSSLEELLYLTPVLRLHQPTSSASAYYRERSSSNDHEAQRKIQKPR